MAEILHSRRSVLICLCLAVAIGALYWPVRYFEFLNYDDNVNVSENRHVQQGLTRANVVWAFTTKAVDYWRPLTWLTHMLDWQLYGPRAGGHHLTNVILHVVNSLLLFAVWRRMTGQLWPSAFLAGLFALHPLHAGTVAWVTSRKDVLSGLFWMLTLLMYARYVEQKCLTRYLQVLLLFALGLMAKPMIMTLPFVLLLLDFWPLKRLERGGSKQLSQLILEKVPLLLLALTSTIVTYANTQHAVVDTQVYPLASRIANALVSYGRYLGKTFWPAGLSVYYPMAGPWSLWAVTGAALLVLAISVVAFRERYRRPYLIVGWLWYLGMLVPVIGLIQGRSAEAMANRFTYLPSIGIFTMVAWGLPELLPATRRAQVIWKVVALAVFVAMWVGTRHELRYWQNSVTLFKRALAVTKNNAVAHSNLGAALAEEGHVEDARGHFEQALRIDPDYAEAHNNLGLVQLQMGEAQEAVEHFERVLQIKPDSAQAHSNLGIALTHLGRRQEAIAHWEQALQIDPDCVEAHYNLGLFLAQLGKVQDAAEHWEWALRVKPDYAEAHYNLGGALWLAGRKQEAVNHWERALQIKPDYAEAHRSLGLALEQSGRIQDAIGHYEMVLQIQPNNPDVQNHLARLLATIGSTESRR